MTESEFLERAGACLDSIEAALDASAIECDLERHGSVLDVELADGSKIVINSQTPMRQLWVAARSGGFHFGWDGTAWRDTRDGSELFAALSRVVSAQGGEAVVLRPRSWRSAPWAHRPANSVPTPRHRLLDADCRHPEPGWNSS